jgi:hypothetical protein
MDIWTGRGLCPRCNRWFARARRQLFEFFEKKTMQGLLES